MFETCQMVHHHDNCLNTKKAFVYPCHLCNENCPHGAINEYREIDPKKCTECGVCMAVCPSDGVVDRQIDKFFDYILKADNVVLNCPKAAPVGHEISCLGMLDRDTWILLMLLGGEKEVSLLTGECAKCEDCDACTISINTFKEVHMEWPDHPKVQIKVKPDTGEDVAAPVEQAAQKVDPSTRREALFTWRKQGKDKLEQILPTLTSDEKWPIPRSRQYLTDYLADHPEEKVPFFALVISEACTNCAVCSAICPQGALIKKEGKEKNDDRIILEPKKCLQCNRCVTMCRPKALAFESKMMSGRLLNGKVLLHQGEPIYCKRCGKQIFERTEPQLCVACANTDEYDSYFA